MEVEQRHVERQRVASDRWEAEMQQIKARHESRRSCAAENRDERRRKAHAKTISNFVEK